MDGMELRPIPLSTTRKDLYRKNYTTRKDRATPPQNKSCFGFAPIEINKETKVVILKSPPRT